MYVLVWNMLRVLVLKQNNEPTIFRHKITQDKLFAFGDLLNSRQTNFFQSKETIRCVDSFLRPQQNRSQNLYLPTETTHWGPDEGFHFEKVNQTIWAWHIKDWP